MDLFSLAPRVKEFDPSERAQMGMSPQAPLCQRCNREATFLNPVGVRFRPSWDPFMKRMSPRGILEALCAECRERLRHA